MHTEPANEIAIDIRDVSFAYPRSGGAPLVALEHVSIQVRSGERLGILGPNGGGKSTLLKLMLGLLTPGSGEILICGRPPHEARRARRVGYVPQRVEAELAFPISAREAVLMAIELGTPPWAGRSRGSRDLASECLERVGANAFADRPVGSLSGGQLQRVMIARALGRRPRVLLMDEPTVGIDPSGQQRFGELVSRLRTELGLTIVIVSHDVRAIAAGCDRVACLSRTLHYHDAPAGLTPAVLAEVFKHDLAAVFGDVHMDAHRAAECATPAHSHTHAHGPGCSHDHSTRPHEGTAGGEP
ncbi:MAG: metal ABC transporter ATP-binding protein [Phycisphaeraceae bacterium]|nr:metal ABC transporter ATP-binding protein [Phycisphaeraceae bacterium]